MFKKRKILQLLTLFVLFTQASIPGVAYASSELEISKHIAKLSAQGENLIIANKRLEVKIETNLDPEVGSLIFQSDGKGISRLQRFDKKNTLLSTEILDLNSNFLYTQNPKANLWIKQLRPADLGSSWIRSDITKTYLRYPPGVLNQLGKSKGTCPWGVDTSKSFIKSRELYTTYIEGSAPTTDSVKVKVLNKKGDSIEEYSLKNSKNKISSVLNLYFNNKLFGSVTQEVSFKANQIELPNSYLPIEELYSSKVYKQLRA